MSYISIFFFRLSLSYRRRLSFDTCLLISLLSYWTPVSFSSVWLVPFRSVFVFVFVSFLPTLIALSPAHSLFFFCSRRFSCFSYFCFYYFVPSIWQTAGAVSFVHIVKAAEPLFTALFRWDILLPLLSCC